MSRSSSVGYAACGVTTLLALAPLVTYWQRGWKAEDGRIQATQGKVQLAIDEQDVGDVEPDQDLEVCFLVTNSGSERLLLRQARQLKDQSAEVEYPLYTVSPGRTIAVTARLNSNELAERGRKHLRFETSDLTCPELWLTVRGSTTIFAER